MYYQGYLMYVQQRGNDYNKTYGTNTTRHA